jgi:DNA end-binding protein Ku
MPEQHNDSQNNDRPYQPRPFWSGIIAFGLVSLPVSLFPAHRGKPVSLKMVDTDGSPLKRQFFCEKEGKALTRDEIVRGYEIEQERFVVVEDEELEALAPEKSREIDLKRFVAVGDLDPIYFERAYFLVPDGDTTKAYRLLARTMEDAERAGIATFVMRGKEYLVAILAEGGILRAETMRFHDELRSPADIGLPERETGDGKIVEHMRKVIRRAAKTKLDRSWLHDEYAQRLQRHVEAKLDAGEDVLKAPAEPEADDEEESNVIDLMQVLKDRLQGKQEPSSGPATSSDSTPGKRKGNSSGRMQLKQASRNELYALAQQKRIAGRSRMSKAQLIDALSAR